MRHDVEQSCAVWLLLQLLYDRRMRPKIYRRILNRVLNHTTVVGIGYIKVLHSIFYMVRAARA